jgi:hypothetical protein
MRQVQPITDTAVRRANPQRSARVHDAWEMIVREELRRMRRHAARGSALLAGGAAAAKSGTEIRPV